MILLGILVRIYFKMSGKSHEFYTCLEKQDSTSTNVMEISDTHGITSLICSCHRRDESMYIGEDPVGNDN